MLRKIWSNDRSNISLIALSFVSFRKFIDVTCAKVLYDIMRAVRRKERKVKRFNRLFWSFYRLPVLPLLSSSRRAASATRRFGSMRAQMRLCLMKFGSSCTCHFRSISDRRPLHCLEHTLRNWRELCFQVSRRFDRAYCFQLCVFHF